MANAQGTEILSPLGRLVQGSLWELQDQYEDDGKTVKRDDKGNIVQRAYFAVAVDKNSPEWMPFWQKLVGVASAGYPQYFQNGNCPDLRQFAWKITDGDGFDKYGKPNRDKQGFAGCWVIKFSSSYLPRCFEKGKYEKHQVLTDPRAIKLGYFVRVGAIARPNIGSKTHGLYLNADMVSLEFVGEEIQGGRDANAAFAQAPQTTYVPPGAMQLPAGGIASGNGIPPSGGMPGAMPGMGQSAGMPASGGMPGVMPGNAAMPGTQVQAQTGFAAGALNGGIPGVMGVPPNGGLPGNVAPVSAPPMNPAVSQQMGGAMPGAPAGNGFPFGAAQQQAQPQYAPTEKAAGYTLDQFLANGFTVERAVQEGFFVRVA